MSSSFLSAAERERWQHFPETIPQDDLAVYFFLSDDDTREVNRQREPFNRLGMPSNCAHSGILVLCQQISRPRQRAW
jgi:Domain of unknown function (DUF4158)